jgi:hypothetical protein
MSSKHTLKLVPKGRPATVKKIAQVGRKEDAAKSIACEMENDLATIGDLANAILFATAALDLEDEIRTSIERLTRIILEKTMILEKQRRRAAGQDRDEAGVLTHQPRG